MSILIVFIALLVVSLGLGYLIASLKSSTKIEEQYRDSEMAKSILVKKYPEADLRNYTGPFVKVGLIASLAFALYAFAYTEYEKESDIYAMEQLEDDFEIEPPPTNPEPPPPPPPPPPELEIVEDEEILEDEPEIEDVELDEETIIEDPIEIEEETGPAEPEIFTIVEDMPRFPGCEDEPTKEKKEQCAQIALLKYLAKAPYPPMAKENDIQGKVYVRFVVDEKGKIGDVEVLKGADEILNKAAVEHIKKMPTWTPGKQRGKPVKVYYSAPFNFKLQ